MGFPIPQTSQPTIPEPMVEVVNGVDGPKLYIAGILVRRWSGTSLEREAKALACWLVSAIRMRNG